MNKLFENGEITNKEVIKKINEMLNEVVPYYRIKVSSLDAGTIMMLISFDEKSSWSYGYVENSNYIRLMYENNGMMEMFMHSIYKGSKTRENRINPKFRKRTVKSNDEMIKKLKELIEKVKKELL